MFKNIKSTKSFLILLLAFNGYGLNSYASSFDEKNNHGFSCEIFINRSRITKNPMDIFGQYVNSIMESIERKPHLVTPTIKLQMKLAKHQITSSDFLISTLQTLGYSPENLGNSSNIKIIADKVYELMKNDLLTKKVIHDLEDVDKTLNFFMSHSKEIIVEQINLNLLILTTQMNPLIIKPVY